MRRRTDKRGAALILAIMAMVIMTTIIVEFAYNTRVDIAMLSNYRNAQQGRYFAEVGIEATKVLLLSDLERDATDGRDIDYYAYDASRETESGDSPIAGALQGLAGMGAGQGGLAGAAGAAGGTGKLEEVWSLMTNELPPIPLADTGAMIHLVVTDEASKVNLNQLDIPRGLPAEDKRAKRWVHFFEACGLEEDQALALIPVLLDWIDRDDETTTNGAESQLYQQFDPPYLPRNGPLFGVEELRLVQGVDAEMWAKIAPYVTVFPRTGSAAKLNVNTASKVALQFLDERLDEEAAQSIVDARNKEPFTSDSKFREVLNAYAADVAQNIVTAGYALRSDVYSVRSSALVNDGEYTVTAVLQRAKGQKDIKVLYWRAD
jgi:general secretion pathway protein K